MESSSGAATAYAHRGTTLRHACTQPWWRRPKARTTALVNLAGIMERTDEQLLPAVYRFVGASFRATPSELGYLTLSRAMVQALASPVGGILGVWHRLHASGPPGRSTSELSRHVPGPG